MLKYVTKTKQDQRKGCQKQTKEKPQPTATSKIRLSYMKFKMIKLQLAMAGFPKQLKETFNTAMGP